MKTLKTTLMLLAMMVTAITFTACGDDDDDNGEGNSALVGTWDLISLVTDGKDETPPNAYWVFTENKVTVHDRTDIMNGNAVDYTYDAGTKTLTIAFGVAKYKVLTLSSTTLKIQSIGSEIEVEYNGQKLEYTDVITFKKR